MPRYTPLSVSTPSTSKPTSLRRRASATSIIGREARAHAAARPVPAPPRLLHRVGGIEHHRHPALGAQASEVPHVHHEVAVTEERAPLGHRHLGCATRPQLLHRPPHPFGRHPLALLAVPAPAGRARP